MLKGIQKIGEYYYFFGENTGKLFRSPVTSIDGTTYYPDAEGKITTGWKKVNGNTYYYDENFKMIKGIQKIGEYYYFFGENTGKLFRSPVTSIDGTTYYPDAEGKITTGWKKVNGNTYYYDENFKMLKGIQKIGEYYYFFGENTGKLFKSPVTMMNGDLLFPNQDGILETGWKEIKENKYYLEVGKVFKGLNNISGNKYFFDEKTGILLYGWITSISKDKYYSNMDGVIQIGDITIDNVDYYFDNNGVLYTGWREKGENKYYYYNGIMQKGITFIDSEYYFLGEITGKLWYGWITSLNGNKYYTDSRGVLQRGKVMINNNYYFFGENTFKMFIGWVESISGKVYYLDTNGIMKFGNATIDGNNYYFYDDGSLSSGWYNIGNEKFYKFADGSKAMGFVKIANKRYLFSTSGALLVENCKVYIDVSKSQKNINWDQLWNSGEIDGVIIKISAGSDPNTYAYKENIKWYQNAVSNCERLGIPYGVYWYSYAEPYDWDYYSETINEANQFLSFIKGHNPVLGVYWDLEENRSFVQYNIMVPKFLEIMHNNGIDAKIYCNKSWAETRLQNFKQYISWIAHYTGSKQADGSWYKIPNRLTEYEGWRIWQFTDAASVTGINGYVDMNVAV